MASVDEEAAPSTPTSSKRRRVRDISTRKSLWRRTRWQFLMGSDDEDPGMEREAGNEDHSRAPTGEIETLKADIAEMQRQHITTLQTAVEKTAERTAAATAAAMSKGFEEHIRRLGEEKVAALEACRLREEDLQSENRLMAAELQRAAKMEAEVQSLQRQLGNCSKQLDAAKARAVPATPVMRKPLKPQPSCLQEGSQHQTQVRGRGEDDKRYTELTAAGYLDLDGMQAKCRLGTFSYKTALPIIARRLKDPATHPEELEELEASKEELQEFLHRKR